MTGLILLNLQSKFIYFGLLGLFSLKKQTKEQKARYEIDIPIVFSFKLCLNIMKLKYLFGPYSNRYDIKKNEIHSNAFKLKDN